MAAHSPQDLHRLFVDAFNAADTTALLALYEPDARLAPRPGQEVSGLDAIRIVLDQFLVLRGKIQIATKFVIEAGEVALLRGHWQIRGTAADGMPAEMQGNNIEVARRRSDGTWRFVIDFPFGAD